MRIFDDFYVYPWVSYEANNSNTVFIDGVMPILIDPGHTNLFKHVVEGMARDGKSPERIRLVLCTHGHPDHIEAVQVFDGDVLKGIGSVEHDYLSKEGRELFLMTGSQLPTKPFQILLKEGFLKVGDKTFRVIHTPGHSPGSLCLYWEERRLLISGDTVFYMGVGRTDLPGGNLQTLGQSIERLLALDVEYLVPGHGEMLAGREGVRKNFDMIRSQLF